MAHPPSPRPAADVVATYARRAEHFDEGVTAAGTWRADWQTFLQSLGSHPAAKLQSATDFCRRAILEQDVSMNVHAGAQSDTRPWPLDVVPLLIGAADWRTLTAGLRQRARLFDTLLRDLYGPQKLLRHSQVPAALAMANPHYLRACAGLGQTGSKPFLHTYAADIARAPDGGWWVIEDRLDAPSGLGYALQNRIIARQSLADTFQATPVCRLQAHMRQMRQSLEQLNPRGEASRVAFLTPGTASETYFEHAYLARYLGYPLVEGADLTTRDRRVYLRTVGGLRRVDTLIRRVDSDFCDPLELNDQSLLGVPGLVASALAGRVALANQLGARALESNALLAFLNPLSQHVSGEDLLLPNAATWWCGQPAALAYVLANLHALVIKPTFATPDAPPTRYGASLSAAERAVLAGEIRAQPWRYCGQERILRGTTPGWDPARATLRPMPFVLRVFLTWVDGDYVVMPGGLTRCNPDGEEGDIALRSGSITKDTWVIDARSPEATQTLLPSISPDVPRAARTLPSRLGDNFFWLGRYLERTGALARLLERLDPLLQDEIAGLDPGVAEDAARLLLDLQQLSAPAHASIADIARQARLSAADPQQSGGLAANATRLGRVLDTLRARLPRDAWQIARELRQTPARAGGADIASLRDRLQALDGILAESLPRDAGWRFLDLGRSVERGGQTLFVLQRLLGQVGETVPTEFRLQTALHLADCLFAYRAVCHGAFAPRPVLRWLVADPENIRGLRLQAERINQDLEALPVELAPAAVAALRHRAFELLSTVRLFDLDGVVGQPERAQRLWIQLRAHFADLSDRLSRIYFSHAESDHAGSD